MRDRNGRKLFNLFAVNPYITEKKVRGSPISSRGCRDAGQQEWHFSIRRIDTLKAYLSCAGRKNDDFMMAQ